MENIVNMDKISSLLERKDHSALSIYYTAGFPQLGDTLKIAQYLEQAGADLIEIGMPYSDPVADGPTIQQSNQMALENGMTIKLLMDQLEDLNQVINIPVVLMGYVNPILQYGIEGFCKQCHERGVSGLIIPDLPIQEYLKHYQQLFAKYQLTNIFLITPQTSDERIRWIDQNSSSFIYAVSDASITGAKSGVSAAQQIYFRRLQSLGLSHPFLIGFGISDHESFSTACQYAQGAIIGSAFIEVLKEGGDLPSNIEKFIHSIKVG